MNITAERVKKFGFPSHDSFCFASHSDFWESRWNLKSFKNTQMVWKTGRRVSCGDRHWNRKAKLTSPFHFTGRALSRRGELFDPCFILPLTSPITLAMCLCGHFLSHLLSHLPVQHFRDALTHVLFNSYHNGCAGVWGTDVSHPSTSNSLNILTTSIELKAGEKSKVKDILCKLQFRHFSWIYLVTEVNKDLLHND